MAFPLGDSNRYCLDTVTALTVALTQLKYIKQRHLQPTSRQTGLEYSL